MSLLPPSIVSPEYRHIEKWASPLDVDGGLSRLKWYTVRERSQEVSSTVIREASEIVARLIDARDVGFVLIHLCGPDFVFLIVSRWRSNNELWETVFGKTGSGAFEPVLGGATRATFCVWELGIVGAERAAWTTFLKSERKEGDLLNYQSARFVGPV
jgi:hypothetical protein